MAKQVKERDKRAVNWLEHTSRSIRAHSPETGACSDYVTERLSALLLERLPGDLGSELLNLLPEHPSDHRSLRVCTVSESDRSIGYQSFIERASHAIGCQDAMHAHDLEALSLRVADAFLWSVLQEIPPELKQRISEALPSELRSRMNVFSAHSDEAKVA